MWVLSNGTPNSLAMLAAKAGLELPLKKRTWSAGINVLVILPHLNFLITLTHLLRLRKEQNCHPGDGQHCPEKRLPTDLLLEHKITDGQNDHRWQSHQCAGYPDLRILNSKQGAGNAHYRPNQGTQCQQTDQFWISSHGRKGRADFAFKSSQDPDEKERGQRTNCICLEWREFSKQSLFRQD